MHCKDTWTRHIPPNKLAAYKQLLDEGQIRDPHVTYVRDVGLTIVEYESDYTHTHILDELAKRC